MLLNVVEQYQLHFAIEDSIDPEHIVKLIVHKIALNIKEFVNILTFSVDSM